MKYDQNNWAITESVRVVENEANGKTAIVCTFAAAILMSIPGMLGGIADFASHVTQNEMMRLEQTCKVSKDGTSAECAYLDAVRIQAKYF